MKKTKTTSHSEEEIKEVHQDLNCFVEQTCSHLQDLNPDPTDLLHAIDAICDCNGKVVTVGMGKAGIAMRKFASTLCSFGISACYLHPGEASHGDLGCLSKEDVLFVASTSGKTREIMEIMFLCQKIPPKTVIGITSHSDSPIRENVDIVLEMGDISEVGYLHMAPTTSIILMLTITDLIATSCAKKNGLNLEDYGKYHHGGYLGSVARDDQIIH